MAKNLIRFDWAIKKLLRSKANFGILEGFLSELLKQDLKIMSLLESEGNQEYEDGKQNRVDVLVQLQNGEVVLIEVQVNTQADYFHRMLYGTSKIIGEYLKKGEPYLNIKKVYSINILYFDLGHGKDYIYHGRTKFIGMYAADELDLTTDQKKLYQKEFVHEIYPEYYLIKVNQFNDIAKNTLDEWIYFLKNEEIREDFKAKGLSEAKNKLDMLKLSETERQSYNRYLEELTYQASMTEVPFLEGKQSGIDQGRVEGEKLGLKKVALSLLKRQMSIEQIVEITNLPAQEIEELITK